MWQHLIFSPLFLYEAADHFFEKFLGAYKIVGVFILSVDILKEAHI